MPSAPSSCARVAGLESTAWARGIATVDTWKGPVFISTKLRPSIQPAIASVYSDAPGSTPQQQEGGAASKAPGPAGQKAGPAYQEAPSGPRAWFHLRLLGGGDRPRQRTCRRDR